MIQSFALSCIVRAPDGIGTFRAITRTPPVPLATVTEDDIHAQPLLDS
jgi:hypothetical protein